MPSANAEDLNSCCDSYSRITKVEICVAWVVHLHLCLLGCAYCLLTCWSGCHMFSSFAIWLQPNDEHMLSS
jgi:hypothetical protein